ncbi:MAG: 50S ribosomal protein L11 methyltransferase [Holosporales bacterium]|jgi:SAM-dependent methyltransferase|nr:50S ribosomal protein L11 methyltransferase [Holosporales bacterium]
MSKDRFAFGKNWTKFLKVVDEERIKEAERSLLETLKEKDLTGKRFLDIGSGSGLFSLAAYRLGAEVISFDYDADSVRCTQELKNARGGIPLGCGASFRVQSWIKRCFKVLAPLTLFILGACCITQGT